MKQKNVFKNVVLPDPRFCLSVRRRVIWYETFDESKAKRYTAEKGFWLILKIHSDNMSTDRLKKTQNETYKTTQNCKTKNSYGLRCYQGSSPKIVLSAQFQRPSFSMYHKINSIDEPEWHTHDDLFSYLSKILNKCPKKIEDGWEDGEYQKSLLGP